MLRGAICFRDCYFDTALSFKKCKCKVESFVVSKNWSQYWLSENPRGTVRNGKDIPSPVPRLRLVSRQIETIVIYFYARGRTKQQTTYTIPLFPINKSFLILVAQESSKSCFISVLFRFDVHHCHFDTALSFKTNVNCRMWRWITSVISQKLLSVLTFTKPKGYG